MIKKIAKYLFAAVFVVVFVIIFIFLSRKIFVKVFNHFATSEVNVSNIAESSLDAVESEGIKDRTVKVVKGIYVTKQEWSGDVVVVGDVTILSALEIAPGTRIAIAAGKDEAPSRFDIEIHADGFNDDDPTRLKSYADTHISIFIVGSLTAKGTEEHPIIFTSDSDKPHYADWAGLNLVGNASVLDYVVVEYSRNGIAVPSANENMVVRNSIVRHAMWGCFSVDGSNGLFENNLAQDCGHEGFDVGGKALIKNNTVEDSHAAVVVLHGTPILQDNILQDEVHSFDGASPKLISNTVDSSLRCSRTKVWDYENYRIPCYGEPYIVR